VTKEKGLEAESPHSVRPRMSRRGAGGRLLTAVAFVTFLGSCGGGSSSPTNPSSPTPPAVVYSVLATVYYDVNRNNVLDPEETVRLFDVDLEIGGGTGRTEARTGQATVQGVPAGAHQVVVQPSSLPPFFAPGATTTVVAPQTEEAFIPVALPIGQNNPFWYLATGDSITKGTGSDDETGYRSILLSRLREYYDRSVSMFYRGRGGGTSMDGAVRTAPDISLLQPAYALIGWGTNDWNICGAPATCDTVPNLRSMVRDVKAGNSLPCVATLLPTNVGYDGRATEARNEWVAEMNDLIKAMAIEEGALVVDLHAAFMGAGSLSDLFVDHVHPNPRGYDLIAETWFNALTRPRALNPSAAHMRADALAFAPPLGGARPPNLAGAFSPPDHARRLGH
jgi:lysophospholipase L1-like esterase